MLSKFKRNKYQQHLAQLPKIPQTADDVQTLHSPERFRTALVNAILNARKRIYLVALYLEHDDGGMGILSALYEAKRQHPELDTRILVDWHRAQRGRIGAAAENTNADWYCDMARKYPDTRFPIYGIPVNTREALGVLHLKGFIIDDTVIYSGASLNDVYLHQHDKYRYDRYQIIHNPILADTMAEYIQNILSAPAINRLDRTDRPKSLEIKNETRQFRQALRTATYHTPDCGDVNDQLTVTPLVGLGKQSPLNKTIHHLMYCTDEHLVMCTPYFNLPALLVRNIIRLLREGKKVEIIIGDKTANDFYIPEDQPFKIIGALPYLYEINLRRFLSRLQRYIDNQQLVVRLWKDGDNSFHLKGMWIDNKWQLLTGNNLNPRAWRLDLENAILIHDPKQVLLAQRLEELDNIKVHTQVVTSYMELESIAQYPVKVRKLIRRLRRIRIDRLISRIL
ncbi:MULTISPECIES: CDP-diacylglycerol--serine O-phosphatidyltransferase [unclassified Brenneria]|uniref:CDP-diacylglycerol--serine O-phosphatidyltransferase n=1 Tax=unclassified Brenneria TaxID=2634434 RepID=UPI0015543E47|nr:MULTISPECIES: CDP-diacylglycerol--serine O-phosphatidyltransferase [unclassified Brenneria]MBJ7223836.1 CDP-diacylglycerol--serine O-phosphatidyltransferase [Brenneria sp. L3-3C-1]MEE3645081.1 CDP-diacylglycerol--serine O-phosphatidyltransferase [Brenneria sp. L3_3C_1]MEE3652861.1 CDP-diacylglycerol--serine O-phosphatidyltransferase [Brenneria sp. HEZEL_4_2_4]NPD02815.1 CDP-diacylglycerol--serine O-phosphatidyltransferase [Brenneria sp. hezel4-2-4]